MNRLVVVFGVIWCLSNNLAVAQVARIVPMQCLFVTIHRLTGVPMALVRMTLKVQVNPVVWKKHSPAQLNPMLLGIDLGLGLQGNWDLILVLILTKIGTLPYIRPVIAIPWENRYDVIFFDNRDANSFIGVGGGPSRGIG